MSQLVSSRVPARSLIPSRDVGSRARGPRLAGTGRMSAGEPQGHVPGHQLSLRSCHVASPRAASKRDSQSRSSKQKTQGHVETRALSYGDGGGGGKVGDVKGYGGDDGDDNLGPRGVLGMPAQLLHSIAEGWVKRVQADPEFAFKLAVECLNDALIIIAVNAANRGSRFFKELEFVLCHLAVSLLNDVSLVWLLAPLPASAAAAAGSSIIARLPQHCFQAGAFSLQQRLGCLAYKGGLYACIGLVMGMAGTALVHGLTSLREKMDPEFKAPAEYQPVVRAGLVWALYMGVSSNLRYQSVNGMERLLYSTLPGSAAKALTVGMRMGNNFLGSMIFVWLARKAKLNQPRPERVTEAKAVLVDA